MEIETITDKQGICLLTLFLVGTSMLIGVGGGGKQDAWLASIFGFLFSIPAVLIYARLLFLFEHKNLFEILKIVFGKFIGDIISLVYIFFSLHLGSLVLRNYSDFTNVSIFPDTPPIVPLMALIILCIYGVKMGIEVLGRFAEYNIGMVFLLIATITVLLSIPFMDINNLRPVLYYGIKPVLQAGFGAFSFPFAESVILTMCFSSFVSRKSPYKIYLTGISIAFAILFIVTLRNLLIQGPEMLEHLYFPSYVAVSLIRIGTFIQRLESVVAIILLINVFIKLSLCIVAAAKGVTALFNFSDYKFFVTPCAMFMVFFSIIVYKSTMEMEEWAFKVWPYYAFIFQAILPVLILIFSEIKARRMNLLNINKKKSP